MAAILVYAGVKSYQKFQTKKANSTAENQKKSRKNRKSISSLVIPSVASAHIIPGYEETMEDSQPPQYELYEEKALFTTPIYTAQYSPDTLGAPTRMAPPPPVMLGLTLCESPVTPTSELDADSEIDFRGSSGEELREDCPVYRLSQAFEIASEEPFDEPTSPAPLHVVKRDTSPLPPLDEEPGMTYSSDENEDCDERHRVPERSTYLEVPRSAEQLWYFEPPPIPPKSPARKLRAVSN